MNDDRCLIKDWSLGGGGCAWTENKEAMFSFAPFFILVYSTTAPGLAKGLETGKSKSWDGTLQGLHSAAGIFSHVETLLNLITFLTPTTTTTIGNLLDCLPRFHFSRRN